MTTAAERQSRRRTKLNKIAQNAEIETWGKLETALLRNEIDITIIKKGKIKINAKQAIKLASTGEMTDKIAVAICEEVEPLCKTNTGDGTSETTSLYDWIYEGSYTGSETPKSIASEWDSLSDYN